MPISIEEARAWGKRDGERAAALAKEDPPFEMEVMRLPAHVMGFPDPGDPGAPARRLCSDWEDVHHGLYTGPTDLPLAGRISREARKIANAPDNDHLWDAYFDAMELEMRRANVALLLTYFDTEERQHLRSYYVVDKDRFPSWNGENLIGMTEDGDSLIEETYVQIAFLPERENLVAKARRLLKRLRG